MSPAAVNRPLSGRAGRDDDAAVRTSVPPRCRVSFLIRDLDIGGAQRQLIELASGMHRAGWPVRVLVFYGGGALEGDLVARGVALHVLHKSGRWDVLGFWSRLLRALRRRRPDILHSYLGTENIVSVSMRPFLRGTRVVWGVRSSNMDFRQYGRLPQLVFFVERQLARFTDLIICNSSSGREARIAHGYPAQRMVVIPNGIDSERFSPDARARAEVRREWGVGDAEMLVGIVARLDPKKGHSTFLRAAASVVRARDGVRFVCVGDGPEPFRAGLTRLASDLQLDDHLIWAGARRDMPRVHNALDLLVSSSSWGEGFPNVVAEAMACGVPCVVTEVGDSVRVVGETGWVCQAQSADALSRAVLAALKDTAALRDRGHEARLRIASCFSVAELVRRTSEQFIELAGGTGE